MPWIVFEEGGRRHSREIRASATLGRHPSCDVQVLDKGVSKFHCKVFARDGAYWLEDLHSLNGTMLNGVRTRGEHTLRYGDRIQLGAVIGTFLERRAISNHPVLPEGGAPPPPPPFLEATAAQERVGDEEPAPVENGLLTVERGGDMHVRLWNVEVGRGGLVIRIPLAGDKPPSSRLHTYGGKSPREELCLEDGDAPFEALLAEATRDGGGLPERERVTYLTGLVYRTLGGHLTTAQQDACRAACQAFRGQRMPIGELVRLGVGVCRHRAFLFFHLARKLGLRVEMFRGAVRDVRHAWNEVRIDGQRLFVDASLGVVLEGALDAERAFGYTASRFPLQRRDGDTEVTRALVLDESAEEPVLLPRFRHELRKVPGDDEAVLLLYPEGELPEVRFVHVELHAGPECAAMFAMAPFLAARVFSIVGDEAHHLMDAVDPAAMERLQAAWGTPGSPRG